MIEREEKIEKLKMWFETQKDIVLAFLFGSQAKGYARPISDWDVGIFLVQESKEREQKIWKELERIVGAEVDLVVLNRAPAKVAWPIVGTGITLTLKDHDVYMKEVRRLSEEADAWYTTADEYYRTFMRSASLSEADKRRLQEIVEFLSEAVKEYVRFRAVSQPQYMNDKDLKRSIEHWVEHMVNASVDIARTIWASERRPLPETYREFLIALGGIAPFDQDDICEKLSEWVRLRNMLAHEYLDYRWKDITEFLAATQPLFEALTDRTKKFLEGNFSA